MEKWLERHERKVFVALFFLFALGFFARYAAVGYGIGSGGNYYYFWLPTVVLDNDLDFSNQWEKVPYREALGSPLHYEKIYQPWTTSTGRVANENAMGPAIFWSPFFIAAHLAVLTLNGLGFDFATDGFSDVHQIITMLGSIFWATLGLWLVYRFSCRFFKRWISLLATLAITFGFTVVHYIAVEPSMAHGLTVFTVAAFLTYWYDRRFDSSWRKWVLLGVLGGLMMHSRWQEGFFFIVPAVWWVFEAWKADWRDRALLVGKGFAFVAAVLVVFSPQMLAWKVLYGGATSLPDSVYRIIDFLHPRVFDFLFSFQHSLLISTPIVLVSLFGIPYLRRKDASLCWLLLLALLINIYVNASLVELGGNAFGARRMTDNAFTFVLLLAALLDRASSSKWFPALLGIIVALVGYNLLYALEYSLNLIHRVKPVTPRDIFSGALRIVERLRLVFSL